MSGEGEDVRGKVFSSLRSFTDRAWFDVILISLAGLLPLTWFRGALIAGWDLPWPIGDPQYLMKASMSTWNPSVCLGAPDPSFRVGVYLAGNLGLDGIGLSGQGAEMLWFVLLFAGTGLSAYALIRVLYPGHRLAAVTGALFYMFNPYYMIVRWGALNLWPFFYAFLPLMLALFILLIRSGRLRYLIAFLLVGVVVSPSHANLGSVVILAIALGGYLVVYLVQNRRAREKVRLALLYTLILAVLFLGISMWWVLPSITSLQAEASSRLEPGTTMEVVEWSSEYSTWHRVLRLQGYQGVEGEYLGSDDPVTPYAEDYYTPLTWILGWMIPALAIAGLWKVRRNPGLVWPAILWVAGVFLMKGIQPPLGGIARWMYQTIPGMSVFRVPYDKFGMLAVLGLAPLVGAGMEGLYRFSASLVKRKPWREVIAATALVVVAVLLLGVLVWPLWSGDAIYGGGSTMPSLRVDEIPAAYGEAREWLEGQQEEFRILPLPYNRGYWVLALFDWYLGHDPTRWLVRGDTVTPDFGFNGGDFAANLAYDVMEGRPRAQFLCTLLNVKYVLLREDVNWEVIEEYPPSWTTGFLASSLASMRGSLETQEWLEPAATFGSLTFYRNRHWKPLQVYSAHGYEPVVVEAPPEAVDPEVNLAETGEGRWRGFGPVDWEEEEGELTLTATSGSGEAWAGIRRPLELGDGPFVYSFEMRTRDTTHAHMKVEWRDGNGAFLEDGFLQPGVDGDTDWTSYAGVLRRPQGAASADIMVLMQPREGAALGLRDLVLREKGYGPWQWFGPVEWKEGEEGELTVTATADSGAAWAGIRRPLELGDGPFVYSFEMRTRDTKQAHL
ncbi:MAG: hypothetical protein PHS26_13965, partial [Actinomycetota bacterium]|nr:hypothetical protein [Actinomycetota bacterium]